MCSKTGIQKYLFPLKDTYGVTESVGHTVRVLLDFDDK